MNYRYPPRPRYRTGDQVQLQECRDLLARIAKGELNVLAAVAAEALLRRQGVHGFKEKT